MGDDAKLRARGQLLEVAVVDPPNLEHVVRAHDDAILLPLASSVIDDRGPRPLAGTAPLTRAVGVLCCSALLVQLHLRLFS